MCRRVLLRKKSQSCLRGLDRRRAGRWSSCPARVPDTPQRSTNDRSRSAGAPCQQGRTKTMHHSIGTRRGNCLCRRARSCRAECTYETAWTRQQTPSRPSTTTTTTSRPSTRVAPRSTKTENSKITAKICVNLRRRSASERRLAPILRHLDNAVGTSAITRAPKEGCVPPDALLF